MSGRCRRRGARPPQFDTRPACSYNWHSRRHAGLALAGSLVPGNAVTSRERGESLSQVVVREGETFDSLLRRFNKRVQMDGILSEARRRSHFEKPSVQRKRKAAAKRRKSIRSTNAASGMGRRR